MSVDVLRSPPFGACSGAIRRTMIAVSVLASFALTDVSEAQLGDTDLAGAERPSVRFTPGALEPGDGLSTPVGVALSFS